MRYWFITLAAIALVSAFAAAPASAENGVHGRWLTESGNAHVEIKDCGGKLCGEVVWLKEPLNDKGEPKRDRNNPDATLRDRPIMGLAMLADFVPGDGPDNWANGRIYNPEDGKTYNCNLSLQKDGTLRVRGYIGVPLLGQTQIWTRAP